MGKRKNLSKFDKDQIMMARRLDQSISKTAALVGCSRSAVVRIYQKCSKEGTVVNRRQGHGRPRLIDARRLARVVRSNRRATVAQTAQEVNAGSDRKRHIVGVRFLSATTQCVFLRRDQSRVRSSSHTLVGLYLSSSSHCDKGRKAFSNESQSHILSV
ncbi:hypothetical protein DPX16_12680 [Anabarilius grahami]|uniref:Transposase Tc1-like domain-containing protein n=1 Tax=Anabarilius grahami TaxID=495550 RepID=A0A3N0XTD6_ANAGA|nr:hypothetical protein DPX16_12680 [Anabarilius grahami]